MQFYIEKSHQEGERKIGEVTAKLEQAIAARQEMEAELALARKTISELSSGVSPVNIQVLFFELFYLLTTWFVQLLQFYESFIFFVKLRMLNYFLLWFLACKFFKNIWNEKVVRVWKLCFEKFQWYFRIQFQVPTTISIRHSILVNLMTKLIFHMIFIRTDKNLVF